MDDAAAYLALTSRDARFDGRLFVGVTSTGIYCRPICRVRTPKRANCRFFATAAQAEAQAFRPCLKCRPEIAPGPGAAWSAMDASRTLARQAADHLDAHAGGADGEMPSLAALAARLGVSDRHLRRIFVAEHGVTPVQHLQTRRLLLAKQLLTDSRLPVSQVALASGFRSLRRFNAAFADNYRMSPGRLRREAADAPGRAAAGGRVAGGAALAAVTVTLGYRAPYDAARLLRFFAQRAIPGIEQVDVDGTTFGVPGIRRSVRAGVLSAAAGWIEALFPPARAEVRLRFDGAWAHDSGTVVAAARRWLDLDASPHAIAEALLHGGLRAEASGTSSPHRVAGVPHGGGPDADGMPGGVHGGPRDGGVPAAPASRLPVEAGLRLPGCLDAFELAVRAVLGQQVTVAAARTLARRLVDRFGEPPADAAVADVASAESMPARTATTGTETAGTETAGAAAHAATTGAALARAATAGPAAPAAVSPWPEVMRTFPSPDTLAGTPIDHIAALGIVRGRSGAIVALARAWPELVPLTALRQPAEPLVERLCALPGIGPWTAHYIAMRVLSWPDAFPPGDVAVLKAMQRLFGDGPDTAATSPIHRQRADAIAQAWRPWRSYAVLGLWNTLEAVTPPPATSRRPAKS